MQNTVVVRYPDGRLIKGTTHDFLPNKSTFHVTEKDTGQRIPVDLSGLKAVFFVKTYDGSKDYREKIDGQRVGMGRKIQVKFKDGETLVGYTQGYTPNRPSFFVFPADPNSNNERILVITAATESVQFL